MMTLTEQLDTKIFVTAHRDRMFLPLLPSEPPHENETGSLY
jgi:hypothetical protein